MLKAAERKMAEKEEARKENGLKPKPQLIQKP